jgi:hypothetical protein
MTKWYEVSGKSKVRPTDLPEGFEVTETDDGKFERRIGCSRETDYFNALLSQHTTGELCVALRDGEDERAHIYFNQDGVRRLRDALTEFLGDGPKADDIETRVRELLARGKKIQAIKEYRQHMSDTGFGVGRIDYPGAAGRFSWERVQENWRETFPWKLKTD